MRKCETFEKTSEAGGQDLRDEAAALRWLGAAEKTGGIHVATVYDASPNSLREERVQSAPASAERAERIGRGLACMHAADAGWWGAPPPDFRGSGYVIGDTLTPVVAHPGDAARSWGAYFADIRIWPFVLACCEQGLFDERARARFARVCEHLRAGEFDAPQPELVRRLRGEGGVSRVHGDLWAGNVLMDANPDNKTGGTLIDPMAHGGHAETDLAMLALFGYPFLDRLLAAYNETSQLADGWQERVHLHQLAPLLHHCLLFGHSYVPETLSAAAEYE